MKNSQLHVGLRRCCQLRWTLSVITLNVYNTIVVTECIARICPLQLRLVSVMVISSNISWFAHL